MFTTISQSVPIAESAKRKKPGSDLGPVFAVIEIDVQGDFRPKNVDSVPSEDLGGVPADLVCSFASMFNGSLHAQRNRKWACVGLNGAMFYLRGIQPADRPADPSGFPPGARVGLSYEEAIAIQAEENSERVRLARIPLRWTIALRPLEPVAVQIGGAS